MMSDMGFNKPWCQPDNNAPSIRDYYYGTLPKEIHVIGSK